MKAWPKPFYHIDDVLTRWQMRERDLTAFVLSGDLTLSATVAGLRVTFGSFDDFGEGQYSRMHEGHRYIIGTIELQRHDAWQALQHEQWTISSLKSPDGEFIDVGDGVSMVEHVVARSDLVITRVEMQRFEEAFGFDRSVRSEDPEGGRRGAPARYDWDAFWVEVCRTIHEDGVPQTQSELVAGMAAWFGRRQQSAPDDSTLKKKIRPLWQALCRTSSPRVARTS